MNFTYEDILNIVFYVGALQGMVLSIFLFKAKTNVISNRLLGILTSFWAIILIVYATQSHGLFRLYPHLLKTITHIELTFLPLLYLSVKYMVSRHEKFEKKDFLHFIPLVFNIILYSGFYFQSAENKLMMARSGVGYYLIANIITDEILTLQGIVYPILALILIRKYNKSLPDYQSKIDFPIIRGMKIGTILIFIAWFIGGIAAHLYMFDVNIGIDLFIFVYLFLVIIIYVISYVALMSPETFKLSGGELNTISTRSGDATKDVLSTPDQSIPNSLNEKLLGFMNADKPFLNPELSLQEMANDMGMSRHQLSALINQNQGMNFYEFINSYRVDEIKKLLNDPEKKHFKMIGLAYDAGFNSKASFNRIFKQLTNQTPSEYKAKISN